MAFFMTLMTTYRMETSDVTMKDSPDVIKDGADADDTGREFQCATCNTTCSNNLKCDCGCYAFYSVERIVTRIKAI